MEIVGIKFDASPKIYWFEAGDNEYRQGCGVIVETARGIEYGKCVLLPREADADKLPKKLKPIVRVATEKDDAVYARNREWKPDARRRTLALIEKSGLDMKLVDVEYTFDGSKLVVYFTAESRVDFRNLVRELAREFRMRIELRQIGARDECRMKGGIAPCGRACCCSDHISEFAHVSIKMAKNQNLSLNPTKISGLCGRLMCCLAYENDHYAETNKHMPKVGAQVTTPDGRQGVCIAVNQLKETVRVKTEEGNAIELNDYPLSEIRFRPRGPSAQRQGEGTRQRGTARSRTQKSGGLTGSGVIRLSRKPQLTIHPSRVVEKTRLHVVTLRKKRTAFTGQTAFFRLGFVSFCGYFSEMAPTGHCAAQAPQSMHSSALIS